MVHEYFSQNVLGIVSTISLIVIAGAIMLLVVPVAIAASSWTNGQAASVVLGQSDFVTNSSGTTANSFNQPHQAVVDPTTGKLFVADKNNHRVLRYSSASAAITGSAAESVLGQADFTHGLLNRTGNSGDVAANTMYHPSCLFVDSGGRLWVGDYFNFRVLRFDNASSKADGANADGILGQIDFTHNGWGTTANKFVYACNIFVDSAAGVWQILRTTA